MTKAEVPEPIATELWLLVRDGVAISSLQVPTDGGIQNAIHPDMAAGYVRATDGASIGWGYKDGKWVKPSGPSLASLAGDVMSAAALVSDHFTKQLIPDQAHATAYASAAAMVGAESVPPSTEPMKTAFGKMASGAGYSPEDFAKRVTTITAASMAVSAALMELTTAAEKAGDVNALKAVVNGFQKELDDIADTAKAAGIHFGDAPIIYVGGVNA